MILHRSDDPRATAPYFEHGLTLVEFYAKWCGTCRALTRTLRTVEAVNGVPVVQIDVDDDPAIARRFHVLGVPQLLYMKDGVELARKSGSLDESEFAEWFAEVAFR